MILVYICVFCCFFLFTITKEKKETTARQQFLNILSISLQKISMDETKVYPLYLGS